MAEHFACPYLGARVELTAERRRHVALKHEDVLSDGARQIAKTLMRPDVVVRSRTWNRARVFARGYDAVPGAGIITVVVVTDRLPVPRHWIVTAYLARSLPKGAIEWERS